MAIRTDEEPKPRAVGQRPVRHLELAGSVALPPIRATPAPEFFDVLARRRSGIGEAVPIERVGSLLWYSTHLRARGFDGRFGQWESRPSPSAGGLHPMRLLVLPLEPGSMAGVYDDASHALGTCGQDPTDALALNRASVAELSGARAGTTLQFFADVERSESCYANHETLLWRDAGALLSVLCLVSEALGLTAVPLGRLGQPIVQAFGLPESIKAFGGVHVGLSPGTA